MSLYDQLRKNADVTWALEKVRQESVKLATKRWRLIQKNDADP